MPKAATKPKDMTVDSVEAMINKKFGAGTVKRASDPSLLITRIACGILSIDYRIGGGFARGRHVEIFGSYNVGKTYTAYRLIAAAQALGLSCHFIDAEGTFDPKFAESAGVDLDLLGITEHGPTGNRIVSIMETFLQTETVDVLVLDSIASLVPTSETEGDMEAGSYGTAQAKLMSQALRRITRVNKKTVILYINQTREAIGVVFGKRSITSGGRAMGFYAATRLEFTRTESIKKKAKVVDHKKHKEEVKDVVVGHRVLVRVEKDKTGGVSNQSESTFVFNYEQKGVDHIEDLIYLGLVNGFVKKKGEGRTERWWIDGYEDEASQGRPRFKAWLRRNVAVAEELEEWIWGTLEEEPEEDE